MDEALLDGLGPDRLDIYAFAVVRDLDDDHIALIRGPEEDRALLGLARGTAFLGRFDAMIEGIAHGMHEGIEEILDDRFIELRLLALYDEVDFFVEGLGEIAHEAGGNG